MKEMNEDWGFEDFEVKAMAGHRYEFYLSWVLDAMNSKQDRETGKEM